MTGHELPVITGSGSTATVTLLDHLDAIRAGDIALQQERDRRYAEVSIEREKAQISSERGTYVTKDELQGFLREIQASIRPLTEFVASQQGRSGGTADRRLDLGALMQVLAFLAVVVTLFLTRK